MSTLAESISLLSGTASFEPIGPQERLVTRPASDGTAYLWPVDESELARFKKAFNDNSSVLDGTWVSRPRENCHACGKREEFIDTV